jgi:outer membrane protein assembly factor BamB
MRGRHAIADDAVTSCVGDCDGDQRITINELLTMVNITLGNLDIATCQAGDANGDLQITIDEILTAVNNLLDGCPAPITTPTPSPTVLVNVAQHHLNPSRDGFYVDSALTKATVGALHRDLTFSAAMVGPTYAQPLYIEGGAQRLLIVATEQNTVYGFDAATGSVVWQTNLGIPVALADLPCGDIDPLGVTGTPIIDLASRTLYLDAMTTPDGGLTKKHLIFALAVDNGNLVSGWPVDVNATASFNSFALDSSVQNQRGALQLLNGTLYVPYGGHDGDCGNYHGWVVGVPVANPAAVQSWATRANGGGAWSVSGVATDGASLYVATGNTFNTLNWSDGEAILRLQPGPLFSGRTVDYFAPTDWAQLDAGDLDIGGTGPVLVDVPGATPSKLVVALGKNGVAYLLDRDNLGGIGQSVTSQRVASNAIINAAAAYRTAQGMYVVFKGAGVDCPGGVAGDLTAIKIGVGNPPTITVAWCARQHGEGSPIVTTSDGTNDAIVWGIGAEGDQRLVGFDGDTGHIVYAGGGANELMAGVRRFQTAIVARGRIFVAGDNSLYAFTP